MYRDTSYIGLKLCYGVTGKVSGSLSRIRKDLPLSDLRADIAACLGIFDETRLTLFKGDTVLSDAALLSQFLDNTREDTVTLQFTLRSSRRVIQWRGLDWHKGELAYHRRDCALAFCSFFCPDEGKRDGYLHVDWSDMLTKPRAMEECWLQVYIRHPDGKRRCVFESMNHPGMFLGATDEKYARAMEFHPERTCWIEDGPWARTVQNLTLGCCTYENCFWQDHYLNHWTCFRRQDTPYYSWNGPHPIHRCSHMFVTAFDEYEDDNRRLSWNNAWANSTRQGSDIEKVLEAHNSEWAVYGKVQDMEEQFSVEACSGT